MSNIFLKRVYEPFDEMDGCRILVDRLWPRGISKEKAKLSFWLKEAAPSPELRKWFCHKPELFPEFRERYLEELRREGVQSQTVDQIIEIAAKEPVTLLYGAKDPIYNHALVLEEEIKNRMKD
ncbi:DUF488 domain-containing protein [Neobacillus mesonae]|uniref:DUF488 domain-containing protein n=1 Tax=Neobacillus mesonae TaxID=1193713 RepID=UPI0020410727|nr:DUF488 domain-containing protein [Neobacillus mesonae]MCM3569740.1 DUF488 domain-containing protein [Neobacillus mesonae]